MATRVNLWFDTQAEEAAQFYTGIFPNSTIVAITRYPDAGREIHGKEPGSVLSVSFELDRQPYLAFNGGPQFSFTEAISIEVLCAEQFELDYYWDRLSDGGDPEAQQCGWLKDRYGLSWQLVPRAWERMFMDPDQTKVTRAFQAMLQMKKLDIAALERAFEGR